MDEEKLHDEICACSICFDSLTYPLIILCCTHIFHEECLLKWVNYNFSQNLCPSCPICRTTIITYFYKKTKDSKQETTLKNIKKSTAKIIRTESDLMRDLKLAFYEGKNYLIIYSISIDEMIELRMQGFIVVKYDRRYQISW